MLEFDGINGGVRSFVLAANAGDGSASSDWINIETRRMAIDDNQSTEESAEESTGESALESAAEPVDAPVDTEPGGDETQGNPAVIVVVIIVIVAVAAVVTGIIRKGKNKKWYTWQHSLLAYDNGAANQMDT